MKVKVSTGIDFFLNMRLALWYARFLKGVSYAWSKKEVIEEALTASLESVVAIVLMSSRTSFKCILDPFSCVLLRTISKLRLTILKIGFNGFDLIWSAYQSSLQGFFEFQPFLGAAVPGGFKQLLACGDSVR